MVPIPSSDLAYKPFVRYEHPSPPRNSDLHIVVIGSCEAESILWSRHMDSKVPSLERRLGRRIASRSWVASDFAPVGKLPFAKIYAASIPQREWILVSTSLRVQHCPVVKKILEGVAENRSQVFLLRVDEVSEDFLQCHVRLRERVGRRSDPVLSTRPPRAPIEGGLFRNTIPDFLPPAAEGLEP